jgi:hypothetical protein
VQISGQARLFRNSDYGAGTGDDASRVQSTASGFEFVLRPLAVCLVASGQGLLTTGFSMPDQRLGTQASGLWRFLRVTWRIASRVIELAIVVFVLNADIG